MTHQCYYLILKGFENIYITISITKFLEFVHHIIIKRTLDNGKNSEIQKKTNCCLIGY
jgi:hypothetical protein